MVVYKQYDQSALDRQYNNRLQTPGYGIHLENYEVESRKTEKEYTSIKDIPYGTHVRELLDIYPSDKPNSKTLLFIHGGYWRALEKSSFQFVAGAFHSYSVTTVLITYPLAPDAAMDKIVASCHRALDWVYDNIEKYNGDPEQVYVAGHSAGGHLATMLLVSGNHNRKIKGVCTLSALFNLIPIKLSELNYTLKMDETTALKNSPVRLHPEYKVPLLVAVGSEETDEFKAQSCELYECWKDKVPIQLMELEGANHYSIVECFADKTAHLHLLMRAMMGT